MTPWCWFCGGDFIGDSRAERALPDGHLVVMHKACAERFDEDGDNITARPHDDEDEEPAPTGLELQPDEDLVDALERTGGRP